MTEKINGNSFEASLTVEAALSFTVFIFTVILLAVPMELLDTQRKIQMVLETTGRELSQYAYICYRRSMGEEIRDTESGEGMPDGSGFLAEGAAKALLAVKIGKAAGEKRISNLDLSGTEISENGEEISLQAKYRLRLPFSVFILDSVPAASGSFKRGWTGSAGGRNGPGNEDGKPNETMVYVGRTGTRYHLSPACHYISNDIASLPWDSIGEHVSSSGTHYKPCGVCGSGAAAGTTVYVMPNGKYYHSRRDCSSIAFYVRKVPLSEVEYLGACSYCGKK